MFFMTGSLLVFKVASVILNVTNLNLASFMFQLINVALVHQQN